MNNGSCCSAHTPEKEEQFAYLFQHIAWKAIHANYGRPTPFIHIDSYAGQGIYRDTKTNRDIKGSPLQAVTTYTHYLKGTKLKPLMVFVESNPSNFDDLGVSLTGVECVLLNQRFEDCISILTGRINDGGYSYGILLIDPFIVDEKTLDAISKFYASPITQRVDLVVHVSATGLKRAKKISLNAILERAPKQHWAIYQFTEDLDDDWKLLVGTNHPGGLGIPASRGYYNIKSTTGEAIFNRGVNLAGQSSRKGQTDLHIFAKKSKRKKP